jgi:hypothetical protein
VILVESYFYANIYTFQEAKERGAKIVRDIWEESDEAGTVRFARVQTVSILCFTKCNYFSNNARLFSHKSMSHY